MSDNAQSPTRDARDAPDPAAVDTLIEELYLSAYINHEDLDDVQPGYEYAVQQLLSDLRSRTHWFNVETECEMMSRAQDRFEAMEHAGKHEESI